MKDYFKNPFVIIGVLGIVYYLYKRNILVKEYNKKNLESNNMIIKEDIIVDAKDVLPINFKNDVEKMSFSEIKKSMIENENLIKSKTLKPNEEKQVAEMVNYLVNYNNKKNFK